MVLLYVIAKSQVYIRPPDAKPFMEESEESEGVVFKDSRAHEPLRGSRCPVKYDLFPPLGFGVGRPIPPKFPG